MDYQKKARCTLNGSAKSGKVHILDHTYANCVDHTGACIFYGVSAVQNLIIFCSNVSNAFGEALPPKQGAFIRPDKAFHDWWTLHKKRTPIPKGYVIPVLKAMQGHPESPRLWEKFIKTFFGTLASLQWSMHHAYTMALLTESASSFFAKWMTLHVIYLTNGSSTSSLI